MKKFFFSVSFLLFAYFTYGQNRIQSPYISDRNLNEETGITIRLGVGFRYDTFFIRSDDYEPKDPNHGNEKAEAVLYMKDPRITGEVLFTFSPRFFRDSPFGYDFTFGLTQFTTVYQNLKSGFSFNPDPVDLGTYATGEVLYFTPRFFYSVGAMDHTPKNYFMVGTGLGFAFFNVKGTAYLTDNGANPACLEAVNDRKGVSAIQEKCDYVEYKENWRSAVASSFFLLWRFNVLYFQIEVNNADNLGFLQLLGETNFPYSPGLVSFIGGVLVDY